MSRNALLLLLFLPVVIALLSQSYFLPSSPSSSSPLRSLLHGLLPHRMQHSTARNQTAPTSPHTAAISTSTSTDRLPSSAWPLMNNTAEGVAFMRYIAAKEKQLPVEEEIVLELILPAHLRDMAHTQAGRQQLKERMVLNTYETVLARTKYIDQTLSEAIEPSAAAATSAIGSHKPRPRPIEQLVILGAGSDTRALRLYEELADKGVVVFEVDVPDTQRAKQNRLLQAIARDRQMKSRGDIAAAYDNIHFVPLNLTRPQAQHNRTQPSHPSHEKDDPLFSALESAGYEESKPTMFVLEGLLPYLPSDTVNDTLHSLHSHAPPTSVLVMDYFAPSPECKQDEVDIVIEQVDALGEPILFMIETEVEKDADYSAAHKHELQALLSKNGWHLIELLEPAEMTERYLSQPTHSGKGAAGGESDVLGEVACFERIVTAINKPAEVEIEIIQP